MSEQNAVQFSCPKCGFPMSIKPNALGFWWCPRCKHSWGHRDEAQNAVTVNGKLNSQIQVLMDILQERGRQERIWSEQNHTPAEWLLILGEEFGEACRAAADMKWRGMGVTDYRKELIQVAAVAVAMIECSDRNG